MNGGTCCRVAILAFAAAAVGCAGLPTLRLEFPQSAQNSGKSSPRPFDHSSSDLPPGYGSPVRPGLPPPTGGVVQAGGQVPAGTNPATPPPVPVPVPDGTGVPARDGMPTALPDPQPLGPGPPGNPQANKPPVPGDPHTRAVPTASGDRLNLAPWEQPTDRVLELTRRLDAAVAQNKELAARIREMESLGVSREQALAEALREVDAASAEVVRTRATLLKLRAELDAVQARLQQVESEDVKILRAMIEALDRLLPPPRREP